MACQPCAPSLPPSNGAAEDAPPSGASPSSDAPPPEVPWYRSPQVAGESFEAFLQRTCRWCREGAALDREVETSKSEVAARRMEEGVSGSKLYFTPTQLHCDGIWLHAQRYWVEEGESQWQFDAPPPPWGDPAWDGTGSGF